MTGLEWWELREAFDRAVSVTYDSADDRVVLEVGGKETGSWCVVDDPEGEASYTAATLRAVVAGVVEVWHAAPTNEVAELWRAVCAFLDADGGTEDEHNALVALIEMREEREAEASKEVSSCL